MTGIRCELLSADQLAVLATGPLPRNLPASEARRSLHRDLYLDTADESLHRRGVVCRIRANADGSGTLSLAMPGPDGKVERLDIETRGADVREVLGANNVVVRRLRGLVDPATLDVRIGLEVDRLTRSAARDWLGRPRLTIHLDRVLVRRNGAGNSATFFQMCAHQRRGDGGELRQLERALEEQHGVRSSGLGARERAELALKWARLDETPRSRRQAYSDRIHRAARLGEEPAIPEFLNPESSLLSFQLRVLTLAEDSRTPLRERLRFLTIVSANVDEFFMVRMAGLTAAMGEYGEDRADDGLSPLQELAAIREMVKEISARQAACLRECFDELSQNGAHAKDWSQLTEAQRETLAGRFRDEIEPLLTPFAITLSPGHPLPRLAHLSLAMAMIVRNRSGGPPRFAEIELPSSLPRFFWLDEPDGKAFVTLEEIVRANLGALYPDMVLEQAFVFRVTRSAELDLDESRADDLLDEVARATKDRGHGVAVRLEVDRSMPALLRALLLEDLRREQPPGEPSFVSDVEEIEGLLDLTALADLDLPRTAAPVYPRFSPAKPFADLALFDEIARRDVLVHHPFESFADTVARFIRTAAKDAAVLSIKMTLYRIGKPSPIADALLDAAREGKAVTVFVELKARFDESINIGWARALEAAGGHVVRGLVGFKNHAKMALIVRRRGDALERYVHIGTGNYNARSGEQYTDLSLFTTDSSITADVADLFNDLTGLSQPPRRASRALLVAPNHLLPGILELIAREAANARAGRPARITVKCNGLSDPDVVRALYAASREGVVIDLVVRGICTLVPGVAGRSERIQVVSVVGRFLEHSRIYRFENNGDRKYFIGSADLRPRNLRRRVELLCPVWTAEHRRKLDQLLDLYLEDPTAWVLGIDGEYRRRSDGGESAQDHLISLPGASHD